MVERIITVTRDSSCILEGICPVCGANLERRVCVTECGWCVGCDVGWSMKGNHSSFHISIGNCSVVDSFWPDATTVKFEASWTGCAGSLTRSVPEFRESTISSQEQPRGI